MKKFFLGIMIITGILLFIGGNMQISFAKDGDSQSVSLKADQVKEAAAKAGQKILVVYFSHSGNTREIANQIYEKVGGDTFEIKTVNSYSSDYDTVVAQAKQEQQSGYKPELKEKVSNIDSYNVIFIGYPNWWGTMPMAVFTFLESYNFSGKTIIPFCTHEGSTLGRSVDDITKLCPKATILEGLAVRGGDVKKAHNDVAEWLSKIGMIK